MNPSPIIIKWVEEFRTAAIAREHIDLLKSQMASQERQITALTE